MLALFQWLVDAIESVDGTVLIILMFMLPALESSAFVGFVFPGEIAILLGGVLAHSGKIPLWAAITAAVLGAFVGDAIGYAVGNRWGRQILHGTVGRLPIIRKHLHRHLDTAEAFLERRGGIAVFLGRFTVALRVLVPGLAGMSKLRYRKFAFYNALGAVVWGAGFVLLGYFAGAAWRKVEEGAKWVGIGFIVLVVAVFVADRLFRKRVEREDVHPDRGIAAEVEAQLDAEAAFTADESAEPVESAPVEPAPVEPAKD